MNGPAFALALIAIPGLAASWMLGYHEGQQTGAYRMLHQLDSGDTREKNGIEKGRDQVCDEIRRYKFSMAKDLDEHTKICGWADMDKAENSN